MATLGPEYAPAVVDVISEAFHEYPVMRFVLGPSDSDDYAHRLRTLVHFFVMARVLRGEHIFGIGPGARLHGAALVSRSTGRTSPPVLGELRERTWAEIGAEARERYEACGAAWAPLQVEVPRLHLNMIGVRAASRGTGLGARLMERVHRLSREDDISQGVSLTTEGPDNVRFYQRFGYELVGRAVVGSGLETWSFFRPDGPP